jgi:hypothetical protein
MLPADTTVPPITPLKFHIIPAPIPAPRRG